MIEIINKPLLLHLVGYLYYWQMGFNSVFKGLKTYTGMATKRQLFAHRNCSSISNCQSKIPTVFLGTLGNFCSIEKFLCIYSMIFSVTPNDDLPNHGWETLLYTQIIPCYGRQASNHCYSHLPGIHPF